MTAEHPQKKHQLATRVAHMGLALAVMSQLATSLVMRRPRPDHPGNVWFELHEYSGLAAMGFVLLFWLVLMLRLRGTDAGRLLPWVSAARRADLRDDIDAQWRQIRNRLLPIYREDAPLAAAIHGLGLLLVTAMAASGTLWYLAGPFCLSRGAAIHTMMEVHATLGNAVWAYLVGHAGMAMLHHYTRNLNLREMWSLRAAPGYGEAD